MPWPLVRVFVSLLLAVEEDGLLSANEVMWSCLPLIWFGPDCGTVCLVLSLMLTILLLSVIIKTLRQLFGWHAMTGSTDVFNIGFVQIVSLCSRNEIKSKDLWSAVHFVSVNIPVWMEELVDEICRHIELIMSRLCVCFGLSVLDSIRKDCVFMAFCVLLVFYNIKIF